MREKPHYLAKYYDVFNTPLETLKFTTIDRARRMGKKIMGTYRIDIYDFEGSEQDITLRLSYVFHHQLRKFQQVKEGK